MEKEHKIWAYRKAAWAVDELDNSLEQIYTAQGMEGLLAIPSIGKQLAVKIEMMLKG